MKRLTPGLGTVLPGFETCSTRTLGKPVINETGLDQKYSGHLQWNPQSNPIAELTEIQNAVADQLGLDLVPSRQSIEMLVVEKTP